MISIAGLWIITTWVGIACSIFLADNYDGNEKIDQQKYQVRFNQTQRTLRRLDETAKSGQSISNKSQVWRSLKRDPRHPVNCFLVVKPGY